MCLQYLLDVLVLLLQYHNYNNNNPHVIPKTKTKAKKLTSSFPFFLHQVLTSSEKIALDVVVIMVLGQFRIQW